MYNTFQYTRTTYSGPGPMGSFTDGTFSHFTPLDPPELISLSHPAELNRIYMDEYYRRMMLLYTTAMNTPGMPIEAKFEAYNIIAQARRAHNIFASLMVPPAPYKPLPLGPS